MHGRDGRQIPAQVNPAHQEFRNSVSRCMAFSDGGRIPRSVSWIEQHVTTALESQSDQEVLGCLIEDPERRFAFGRDGGVTLARPRALSSSQSRRNNQIFETAHGFKCFLRENPAVRVGCELRGQFAAELESWKQQHIGHWRGGPSSILFLFSRLGWAQIREGEYVVFSKAFLTGRADADQEFPTRSFEDIRQGWTARESNQFGVNIDRIAWDCNLDGSERILSQGQEIQQLVQIQNSSKEPKTFDSVTLSQNPQDAFAVEPDCLLPVEIQASTTFVVKIRCRAHNIGVLRTAVTFQFNARRPETGGFEIVRRIKVRCGDGDLADLLKPSAPFQKRKRKLRRYGNDIAAIDGEQLPTQQRRFVVMLPMYEIPEAVRRLWRAGTVARALEEARGGLSPATYTTYFQQLLWLEEISMEFDITTFDMDGAVLIREGPFLALHVPGLAENRPSVMRGDFLIANPQDNPSKRFKGYAHRVERDRVLLKFHRDFHAAFIPNQRFDITFSFRRTPLRLMHHGLTLAAPIAPSLFPHASIQLGNGVAFPGIPGHGGASDLNAFNRRLNAEQRQAVCNIVQRSSLPLPYLIFGPPGTGKTVTLVEAILQVWRHQPAVKILVTAPSNTAADVLLTRLMESVPVSEMFRFMAFNRPPADVAEDVKRYSQMDPAGDHFVQPELPNLKQFRIVVATCTMAAKLHHLGMPRAHFGMQVVDEAGHAWEPECVSAFAGLMSGDQAPGSNAQAGLLVLAGDPKQLGPVVRSSMAREFGLGESLLERLMKNDMFSKRENGQFDERVLTKLVNNYRSHPQILALPNRLFYDGELQAMADRELVNNMLRWEHLPQSAQDNKFPLMFHGVEGEEKREASSPSWFNIEEITVVCKYVRHLIYDARGLGIHPRDIGIITPYNKQAQKIRMALRAESALGEVMVGSTEQFQGQERHVIIISTVRSSDEYIPFDLQHNIGFLNNSKRFNVAVTRAKGLLLVVGNPAVLSRDEHWGQLLWFIVDGGGYTGLQLPPRDPQAGHWRAQARAPDGEPIGNGNGAPAVTDAPEEDVLDERGEGVVDGVEGHAWRAED